MSWGILGALRGHIADDMDPRRDRGVIGLAVDAITSVVIPDFIATLPAARMARSWA